MEEIHPGDGTDVVPETIGATLEGHLDHDHPPSNDTTNDASMNDHPIHHRDDDDDDTDTDEFGDFNHTNVDQGNHTRVDVDDHAPTNDPDGTVDDDTTTIDPKNEAMSTVMKNYVNNDIHHHNDDTNNVLKYEHGTAGTNDDTPTTTLAQHHHDGGDNGAENILVVTNSHETHLPPSIEVDHDNDDDDDDDEDFGDFDTAVAVPPMAQEGTTPSAAALINHDLDEMDAFGNFDSVNPPETVTNEINIHNNDGGDDDDEDFGDFDAAPPVLASSDQPIPDDVDVGDDDDFGDFDEAPAPTDQVTLDDGSSDPPTSSRGVDPMVTKCHNAMSIIFQRYVGEQRKCREKDDDYREAEMPHFDENEILTIESVLASLEADTTPTNQKIVLSQTIMNPIPRLFVTTLNDADAAVTPSLCIVSKKTQHSPTALYPWIDQSFISDRILQSRALVDGEHCNNTNESDMTNRQGPITHTTAVDHNHSTQRKPPMGEPSETAKAFLERIPDLSFMLSNKLSITNNNV